MLRYLADFVTPLHTVVHQMSCQWMETEDKEYMALKVTLMQIVVVQLSDWMRSFHVLLNVSDIAIGSALMQLSEPNWFRLVYYSSQKLSTVERNYSTTERKALGMMYSINKFLHYLLGAMARY